MRLRRAIQKVISVVGPASSANLGPGFDTFAVAIDAFCDRVSIGSREGNNVEVRTKGISQGIPDTPKNNTGGLVAENMMREFGLGGISLQIEKGVPAGKGLGSSAATASAVAFGLDRMFNLKLPREELLRLAASGEIASAGVAHPDNVAGSLFGGFVVVHSNQGLKVTTFPAPRGLTVCLGIPEIDVPLDKTRRAREVLPREVPLGDAATNVSSAALMVAGFAKGDLALIGRGMTDRIVEPARASLIPGYEEVRKMALGEGALGVAISGAGPTMIAFVDGRAKAAGVGRAMNRGFRSAGIDSTIIVTKIGHGARVVDR